MVKQMKKHQKDIRLALCLLTAFVVWTLILCCVDVQAIGPLGSKVGLAGMNRWFHQMTGVNFGLYVITDWLSLIPIGICLFFGVLGLRQWIKRKSLLKVDQNILLLGVFYLLVVLIFLIFEELFINYRPILIDGCLETSYPSSTTLLVLCTMITAHDQLKVRLDNNRFKKMILICLNTFTAFMIIGRLLSGVHWISDIIGAIFLGSGLVVLYRSFSDFSK